MISLRFRPPESLEWTTASFLGEEEDFAAQLLIASLADFTVEVRRGSSFCGWVAAEEFNFGEDE